MRKILLLVFGIGLTLSLLAHGAANAAVPSGRIALRSIANGKIVCAENAGAQALIANRDAVGPWETFEVIDLGGGRIALKAIVNGKIVCAENAGAEALIANRDAASTWETFELIDLGGSRIALKAIVNSKIVCAENAGAEALIANRDAASTWETFEVITVPGGSETSTGTETNAGRIAIQTVNGNYLTAVNGGGLSDSPNRSPLHTDTTQINAWEKFRLIPLDGGYYAIQTVNGNYLTAVDGGGLSDSPNRSPLHTDATQINAWEKFRLIPLLPLNTGYYAIQTMNGNYLTAVNGGGLSDMPNRSPLHTDTTQINAWEKFKIISF